MLTKEQDKLATRMRDAGVPGDFAVLVASRCDDFPPKGLREAVVTGFWWGKQKEDDGFWGSFCVAWRDDCLHNNLEFKD